MTNRNDDTIILFYFNDSSYDTPYPQHSTGRTMSDMCFLLPISFLWENYRVQIILFYHVVKNHSWWSRTRFSFLLLEKSSWLELSICKWHEEPHLLGQSCSIEEKNKVFAKTLVVCQLRACNSNSGDKKNICPGHIGTKQYCPWIEFCPQDKRK